MHTQDRPRAGKLTDLAIARAHDEFGRGWESLGPRLRKAVIAHNVLQLLDGQDEDVPDKRVRGLLRGAVEVLGL